MTTTGDPIRTILAFRNGSIGNTLVAVPALRALKRRHPGARLVVVVDPVGRELLAELEFIDRLIVYDRKGVGRGPGGWLSLVRELRREKPSHAILFKRFFRNELLAFLSGARVRVGFATLGRSLLLNQSIPYREGTSITRLNLELAAQLKADPGDATPSIGLSSMDREQAGALLHRNGLLPGNYLAAHYGGLSTDPSFLSQAVFQEQLLLAAHSDEPIVLVGAGPRERQWAEAMARDKPRVFCLLDQPVRVTAALIESARLFIGMNSGPAHLAAAVGTPEVILFRDGPGASAEVAKWRPESTTAEARIVPKRVPLIGLAIPAYRNANRLRRALESVRATSPCLLDRAVVVDDSGDGQVANQLRGDFPLVRWIVHPGNRGFGAAANRAVAECPADVVVLLNDDIELVTDPIPKLTELFERTDLFAVTFQSIDESGRFREGAKRLVWPFGLPRIRHNERDQRPFRNGLFPSDYAVGGHAAFHREMFAGLRGFDHLFEPFYWEDVDLARRAVAGGRRIGYEPSIVVRHGADGAIRTGHDAARIRRVTQRNRILFGWRHRPRGSGPFQQLALAWYALTSPLFRESLSEARQRRNQVYKGDDRALDDSHIDSATPATIATESPSGSWSER